jgi:hypothetical protein
MLVTGAILTGIGTVALALTSTCEDDSDPEGCRAAMLLVSLATLGPGIPLFIVGMVRRSKHKAWEAQYHPSRAELIPQLRLGTARSPLGLTLESRF